MEDSERKALIAGLGRVDPAQPYGTELFDALARLTVSVALEAVCLRYDLPKKEVQVYLVQRSMDDTAYPGEWHCPGSVMRPGEDFEDVLSRLEEKEFHSKILSHSFVANINPSKKEPEVRGTFLSVVYLCTLEEKENMRSRWFQVFPKDKMPEKTVENHRDRVIPCALGQFLADRQTSDFGS